MITTATLSPISSASDEIQILNRWILKMIGPHVKGRVLEINSGTNSLCPLFIEYNRPIHLNDTSLFHIQALRAAYKGNHLVRAVHDFNFTSTDFQESHPGTHDVFDTVIALNVPMTDFGKMMENIKFVLPLGGTLVMIIPAYTSMYHGLDQSLDDWRRYNSKDIKRIVMPNFSILKVRYFNLAPDIAKDFFANAGLSALVTVQKN